MLFYVCKDKGGKMKNKIQLFRKQSGLSQSQLAQKVGISEISIRKYENNERKPKIETLVKIASALNITLSDLLDTPTVAIPDNWITLFAGNPSHEILLSPEEKKLQSRLDCAFRTLNLSGKMKLTDYAQDLTEIEKYVKQDTSRAEAPATPDQNMAEAPDPDQNAKK